MGKETNNLTPRQFYEAVKGIYKQNRTVTNHFGNSSNAKRVTRGRSHTASSQCEDLLAVYIAANIERFSCIHVDQPLTMAIKSKKSEVLYPDISLVVNNARGERTITDLIDLKTDIGWNRKGFDVFLGDKKEFLCRIRGKTLSVSNSLKRQMEHNQKNCGCSELKVSFRCNYHVVVVSEENAGATPSWETRRKCAKVLEEKGVYLYTLSSGLHPNGYTRKRGYSGKGSLHHSQFNRLIQHLSCSVQESTN